MSDGLSSYRLDKTKLSIAPLGDDTDAREYWHRQPPLERWRAMEFLRQVHFGYDPTTARLQRVLEVVPLGAD
jgi:hypothetical protein